MCFFNKNNGAAQATERKACPFAVYFSAPGVYTIERNDKKRVSPWKKSL